MSFTAYDKFGKRLINRRKKVKVLVPEILSFSAFRDRHSPDSVELIWSTKSFKKLYIEGYSSRVSSSGAVKIYHPKEGYFNLIGNTPFDTIAKTCFVSKSFGDNVFVFNDSSINDLSDNRKIKMKIIETDLSNYPKEIKLKVIVYDSLGNFITNIAEPYGTELIAKKYFKQIVDKAGKKIKNTEFAVKEIHDSPNKYDISLVMDYSGSMTGNIKTLEEATAFFINNKFSKDNYSIVKYDNNLKIRSPLLNNTNDIIKNAGFFTDTMDGFGGGTALYASIGKGTEA